MFRRYWPLLFIGMTACALMLFPQISIESTHRGLILCAESIIPSLFPYLVLTNIWCTLGYNRAFSGKVDGLMRRFFHLPGAAFSALLVGSMGGFPAGAKMTADLYKDGELSKDDSEQVLMFCSNAGPAFILGVIGYGIFKNAFIGLILWMIHILGALLLGMLFRPESSVIRQSRSPQNNSENSFSATIVQSIYTAGLDTIRICTFIIFFSIVTGFLRTLLLKTGMHSSVTALALGSIEISGATLYLRDMAPETAFVASSVLLSWNGLCVHCQVSSILKEYRLSLKKYFLGKLMHMSISLILACSIAKTLPLLQGSGSVSRTPILWYWLCSILLVLLLAAKTSYRKNERNRI